MPSSGWAFFLALLLLQLSISISAQKSKVNSTWLTLGGNAPIVIAKGGFSGLFPDSSQYAYSLALQTSLPNVLIWCDVRLTKDGVGICLRDLNMNNCTDIATYYPGGKKIYSVNGMRTGGWFPVDYTIKDLSNVALIQGIFSRTDKFDGNSFIFTVDGVQSQFKPPGLWLNIEHDLFYGQHNLSMRSYFLNVSRRVIVNYVSSPEVGFLTSIFARLKGSKTKPIFRFLETGTIEPSTNQTYGSLLKNLTFVKTFASGILIPRDYIWPTTADPYLQPHTSIVTDAHRIGLKVYASNFANDNLIAYNYSYDPLSEYISFIDNGDFAVDGVLSDYPVTASEAIGCFSHINKNTSRTGAPTVISHNGASGIYPGCTDMAYQQAVDDGTDFIDCPVQVTKDSVLVCMTSIDLIKGTTVIQSPFSGRLSTIPEIKSGQGIFTFNLTWAEMTENLKPLISTPDLGYTLVRYPAHKNSGNFVTLADFLALAKGKTLSGVLISIEYAAFYAEKMDFSLIDAVLKVLKDSGYGNQTQQQVMIQSTNSSVLIKVKQLTDYKLVYKVDETIGYVASSLISDISKFAHSVAVSKQSIFPDNVAFLTGNTSVVGKLQAANLSVYVYLLRNEYVSQAWDFFSDATVEINSYVQGAGVDGVIVDYPGTATRYRRNTCLNLGNNTPPYMSPVQPGGLLSLMVPQALPPTEAANPPLADSEVVEPPLSPVTAIPPSAVASPHGAASVPPPSGQPRTGISSIFVCFALLFVSLLLF